MAIIHGMKLYKYEGDELQVFRVTNVKEDLYTLSGVNVKKTIKLNESEINNTFIKLTPDAFLNMMITTAHTKGMDDAKDVFMCVNKATDMDNNVIVPSLMIRQNCLSRSKSAFGSFDIIVGDCFTQLTVGVDAMEELMEFDELNYTFSAAIYIDDTEASILSVIPAMVADEFNKALVEIKKSNKSNLVKGFSETLKALMHDNNFLLNYRMIFNILQLDFAVYQDERSIDSNGNLILNKKQKKRFEDTLNQFVDIIGIIKYDKDIDISKIVSYNHIMVSDINGIIYLIAYIKRGDYKVDDDIADAFNIKQ